MLGCTYSSGVGQVSYLVNTAKWLPKLEIIFISECCVLVVGFALWQKLLLLERA